MDALAKMKEEVEKKKRLMEAAGGGADAEAGASAAKKPKKTYMTNGQLKKMECRSLPSPDLSVLHCSCTPSC